jgi:hypothetical protein
MYRNVTGGLPSSRKQITERKEATEFGSTWASMLRIVKSADSSHKMFSADRKLLMGHSVIATRRQFPIGKVDVENVRCSHHM